MKLTENTFKDKVLGAASEQLFEIASDNSVVFEILRNKMYSDKIGAVCREVSSNARDANRENNIGETPITIRIIKPNEAWSIADLSIVFQDEGIGINPDRMSNVFLRYGDSTKRDTNNQTGGFGLGAKTPFAYSDTFTVITVCDYKGKRIKYVYTAMIDSTRVGKMILFDEDETDEPTGTRIVVPISETDRPEFERKVLTATLLWDIKPEYIGFDIEIPAVEYVYENDDYKVIHNVSVKFTDAYGNEDTKAFFRNGATALIDGIPYELDSSQVDIEGNPFRNQHKEREDYVMCYKFGNGELTISANREQLQYDKDTKDVIEARAIDVMLSIWEEFEFLLNISPSYVDTCIIANQMDDNGMGTDAGIFKLVGASGLHKGKTLTFDGKTVVKNIQFGYHKVFTVHDESHQDGVVKGKRTEQPSLQIDKRIKQPIVFFDTRKDARRDSTLFDKAFAETGKRAYVAIERSALKLEVGEKVTQDDVVKHEREVLYELLEAMNLFELELSLYSTVIRVEKSVSANTVKYKKEPEVSIQVRKMNTSSYHEPDYLEVTRKTKQIVGLEEDIVIVPVNSISESKIHLDWEIKHRLSDLVKCGHKVYLCNERNWSLYFEESIGVIDWTKAYDKIAKEKEEDAQLELDREYMHTILSGRNSYGGNRDSGFCFGVITQLSKYLPPKAKALYSKYGVKQLTTGSRSDVLTRVAKHLKLKARAGRNLRRKIIGEKAIFYQSYPLLKYIIAAKNSYETNSWSDPNSSSEFVKGGRAHKELQDAIEYIEMMDKTRKG